MRQCHLESSLVGGGGGGGRAREVEPGLDGEVAFLGISG